MMLFNHHHPASLELFPSSQTETPCPLKNNFPLLPLLQTQPLATTVLSSLSVNLTTSGTSCNRNHKVFVLLWLATSVNIMSSKSIHVVTLSYFWKLLWKQKNESWPLASGPQALGLNSERGFLGDHFPFKEIGDDMAGICWTHWNEICWPYSLPVSFSFLGVIKVQSSQLFPLKSLCRLGSGAGHRW